MAVSFTRIVLLCFVIQLVSFFPGLAHTLTMTTSPWKTLEFGDEDVTIACKVSGLNQALSIQSMEIGKESSSLSLATIYPKNNIVRHQELRQHILAKGEISAERGHFSIILVDPLSVQSGTYTCTVVYLDQHKAVKTIQTTSRLMVQPSGNHAIMKEVKKLEEMNKKQDFDNKKITDQLSDQITLLKVSLIEKHDKINSLNETISKLSVENVNLAKTDEHSVDMSNRLRERIITLEGSAPKMVDEINGLKKTISEMKEQSQKLQNSVSDVMKGAENVKSCCKKNAARIEQMVKEKGKLEKAVDGLICPGKATNYMPKEGLCEKMGRNNVPMITAPEGWE